jgi:spermidine/putrescine transport system ATP-binding protein
VEIETASGRHFRTRATASLASGTAVELFLRPEAMIIQPAAEIPHLNRFEVIVKSLLFDGANSRLLAHPVDDDIELLIALPQNRQFDHIRRDDRIEVAWDEQSGICFASPG